MNFTSTVEAALFFVRGSVVVHKDVAVIIGVGEEHILDQRWKDGGLEAARKSKEVQAARNTATTTAAAALLLPLFLVDANPTNPLEQTQRFLWSHKPDKSSKPRPGRVAGAPSYILQTTYISQEGSQNTEINMTGI